MGLAACFAALFLAKETDVFVEARLRALRSSEAHTRQEREDGLIKALKFAMADPQLRWLYITAALANIGFLGTKRRRSELLRRSCP